MLPLDRRPAPQPERGSIEGTYPNATYAVRLAATSPILASLGGRLRAQYVRLAVGDAVLIERSPFDRTRARIVRREPDGDDGSGATQPVLR